MKTTIALPLGLILVLFSIIEAAAHCEIPCGIYNDELRANLIYEHTSTIEKSMRKIGELRKQNPTNYNQLVRWISNKEDHASEIQHIVSQYFMTQRVKSGSKNYAQKISVLHKMLQFAMMCKQTTDLSHVKRLRSLLNEFEVLYFGRSLH